MQPNPGSCYRLGPGFWPLAQLLPQLCQPDLVQYQGVHAHMPVHGMPCPGVGVRDYLEHGSAVLPTSAGRAFAALYVFTFARALMPAACRRVPAMPTWSYVRGQHTGVPATHAHGSPADLQSGLVKPDAHSRRPVSGDVPRIQDCGHLQPLRCMHERLPHK